MPGRDLEQRLTIVLPLKGRHLFTFRFLWHANRLRLPYRLLIADGQVNEAVGRCLDNSRNDFPELDTEYVRYRDDVDYGCYFTKMADVMQRVRTPYAMLAENDDFLGVDGIEQSLDFLDANKDYVCARAHQLNFGVYSGLGDRYGRVCGKLNHFSLHRECKTVAAPTVTERLHTGGLCHPVYYAVFRTPALLRIWREIAEINFSDLMLYENFFALRALTLGKLNTNLETISYYSQDATSITHAPLRDWAGHLLRSRFT
jgi:glycosyltransferase domain-containing protein